MKFAGKEVRIGFYNAISGLITYNAVGVSVYDLKAPKGTAKPYVILQSYTQNGNAGTKQSFAANVTLGIKIVNGFEEDEWTREPNDYVSNAILELVRPTTEGNGLTVTGFDVLKVNLQGSFDSTLQTDTELLVTTDLIFELEINEQ
jgi:hypothetical protein